MPTIPRPQGQGRRSAAKTWPALVVVLLLSFSLISCSQAQKLPAITKRLEAGVQDAADRIGVAFARWRAGLADELRDLGRESGKLFGGLTDAFR